MIRKVVLTGHKALTTISKPVTKVDKKILSLVEDLKDTLKAQKNPEGVGLAAPQIGINLRIFAMVDKGKIRAIINPKIVSIDSKKIALPKEKGREIMEGCLSLPDYYGPLKRPSKIEITYLDLKGKTVKEVFTGLSSQIVQHEIDHLNGIMFVNKLLEQGNPLYKLEGNEWVEVKLT